MPFGDKLGKVSKTAILLSGMAIFGLSVTYYAYAYPFGMNHTTQKDTGTPGLGEGCWCHNPSASPNTTVSIESGETSFEQGKSYTLRLTVHNTSERYAGFNVAAKFGKLGTAESGTTVMDGELAQSTPRLLTSGAASWNFKYTAPSQGSSDTIYATGNAVNGNGTDDTGDQWAWSPKFVVNLTTAGVLSEGSRQQDLQVWPNPAKDVLHLEAPSSSGFEYRIIDLRGRILQTGHAQSSASVQIGNMAAGSYIVQRIESGRVTSSEKFVVR
jgi:hypothetical protein